MKKHHGTSLVLIALLMSSCMFLITPLTKFALAQSLGDSVIKHKFEPWLWEKVQMLEANGTTRFMTIIVGINCSFYEQNATGSYDFKTQVATLLAEVHNATILSIGKVLSYVNIKIRVPEIKEIAAYEFIDGLGDGEGKLIPELDVSTAVIRSRGVVDELGYNGSGVRVAVLDYGINASHPDFEGKNITWRDFVNGRPTPYDDDGHGTSCAGVATGTGAGSPIGKLYTGVAPGVTNLIIGKMLPGTPATAIDALDWAVSEEAQVISCSWGARRDCAGHCQLCQKADECVRKGMVVVKSAGNEGPDPRTITCPGTAFDVITVGAINDHGTQSIDDDNLLNRSSRGPTKPTQEYPNGRIKPDVVAPGWNIMCPDVGGGYSNFHYTSAAAPHVSGVAALLLQAHPDWSPGMVKSVIMGTARLNDNLQNLTENDRGKGIVDAERALTCATDIPANQADNSTTAGEGDYKAEAHLNGTYRVRAYAESDSTSWALATLNKSFVPEHDMVNPTFLFAFNDTGGLQSKWDGYAFFIAQMILWNGTQNLFGYDPPIHSIEDYGSENTSCPHIITQVYHGTLHTEHTYNLTYGFQAEAAAQPYGPCFADHKAQALTLSIVDMLGPGNPSFEQRLQLAPGTKGEPYWSMNNEGWRELRGDVNGDGICDIVDQVLVIDHYGTYPGHPDWDPDCDINGDGRVDIVDLVLVIRDYGKGANLRDGSYSWYTRGGGDYSISQWLCDFDVNTLKDHQVNFTFGFMPKSPSSQNKIRAEIYYITETAQYHNTSDWVPLTGTDWNYTSLIVLLPDNTLAIKVIIHGQPNLIAWIDDASINIQS